LTQIEKVPVSFQIRGAGIQLYKRGLDEKLDEIERVIHIFSLSKVFVYI